MSSSLMVFKDSTREDGAPHFGLANRVLSERLLGTLSKCAVDRVHAILQQFVLSFNLISEIVLSLRDEVYVL